MKKLFIVLVLTQSLGLYAMQNPEKEVSSEVKKVTVFFENAQITRVKNVSVVPGKTILKFTDLSPYINPKSVQVKVKGDVMVLAVNHQVNYLKDLDKSAALLELEKKQKSTISSLNTEQALLSVIDEEIVFLQENRKIGGKNQELSVINLKEASDFYSKKMTSLKLDRIERENKIVQLREELAKINNQISTQSSKKEFPSGEVLVSLDSKKQVTINVELSYMVANAGWYPSYDIRAKSIEEPLEIVYKANVHQDTKVDWNKVDLSFSSQNPSISGTAPVLKPYYLNFNSVPPSYSGNITEVSGRITDYSGQALPGANIVVTGTTIGTVSDMNGFYSIAIPSNAPSLRYSYIGFNSQELPIRNSVMNVALEEDAMALDEVVVTAYGVSEEAAPTTLGRKASSLNYSSSPKKVKQESSLAIPVVQLQNQTSVEFDIDMPYSIKSDNKSNVVALTAYEVPATYEYYCVPKIDESAFLLGYIVDWEKYNLLEGEANIFFEDTYIGKSILDVRYISDTLSVSLGRDKSVSVKREKIKELSSRKFIGNKNEEDKAWKITVKNNKQQEINMVLLDQVPVPTIESIELSVKDLSGGKRNQENGEVKWELQLKPRDTKEVELRYTLKYPRGQNVVLE